MYEHKKLYIHEVAEFAIKAMLEHDAQAIKDGRPIIPSSAYTAMREAVAKMRMEDDKNFLNEMLKIKKETKELEAQNG